METTKALFLDGPLHGEQRVLPPATTRVEVKDFQWNGEKQVHTETYVYKMADNYEVEGEYAGAIHFRLTSPVA